MNDTNGATAPFSDWAILELMGHRRLGGYVSQQEIAGAAMLRIDIPGEDGQPAATQFYSAAEKITGLHRILTSFPAEGTSPQSA